MTLAELSTRTFCTRMNEFSSGSRDECDRHTRIAGIGREACEAERGRVGDRPRLDGLLLAPDELFEFGVLALLNLVYDGLLTPGR